MFSAILVDDEYWALRGIHEAFPWEKAGFRVAAQTTKSTEALELILREEPDVVFTDIRMPKISGIELMEKVREAGLNTEFVIISGFADFTYAQQAIRQGAFDYCLKPLDLESSAELLNRLTKHLKTKREKKDNEIFEILMSGTYEAGEKVIRAGLKSSGKFYQAVVAIGDGAEENRGAEELPAYADALPVRLGSNKMLYLINSDGDVAGRLGKQEFFHASVGVSRTSERPDAFPRLYMEADAAASGGFILETDGLFPYRNRNIEQTGKLVSILVSETAQKDFERLKESISGIPEFFRSNNLGINDLVYLWNQVELYLYKKYPYAEGGLMEFTDYQMLLYQFPNIGAFTESLYAQIREAGSGPEEAGASSNAAFKNLLQFMQEHYSEPLYLRELAKKYYLNQSYCCYLFKKHTGKTFTEYLNHCRVERAKELLADADLSVEQISQQVGYGDYFYFNKVFKKYCGITPAKYRKSNLGQIV